MQYFALRNAGLYLRVGIGRIAQVRLILRQRKPCATTSDNAAKMNRFIISD